MLEPAVEKIVAEALREQLQALQGSACGICGGSTLTAHRGSTLDHDHQTGMIRGYLCRNCNIAEGVHYCDQPGCPTCLWRIQPAVTWLGFTLWYKTGPSPADIGSYAPTAERIQAMRAASIEAFRLWEQRRSGEPESR